MKNKPSLFDIIEKMDNGDIEIILNENQKMANLFTKKLLSAKARTAHVNKEWFRPLYKEIKGHDYDDDMRIASAQIVFNDKIKKYYFEK